MKILSGALLTLLLLTPQQPRSLSDIANDVDKIAAELRAMPVTTTVSPTGDVQAAFDQAKGGDTIILQAGARYTHAIVLPAKAGLVTVRSSAVLPERRIGPADAPLLATLASGNTGWAVDGTNAANWKFDGIAFETGGTSDVVVLQNAVNVTFDRVLIVGGSAGQKRGIRGNGQNITLTRSYIANIWASGQDSQAFCAWDGAGPYTLVNNYLEAASENVMFGGGDSATADRMPADILIDRNTFRKRAEWVGVGKVVKNLIEFKAARRFVVTNNDFSDSYADAQTGYAWSVKSVNQGGHAPWSVTEDGLFDNNTLHNADNGINIQGNAYDQPGGQTARIVFSRNLLDVRGTGVQIGGEAGALTFDHDTFSNNWTFMFLYGKSYASSALTILNTIANHKGYGLKGDATTAGVPTLTRFASTYTWQNNVMIGGASGGYPVGTWFDIASVPVGITVGK